VLLLDFSEFERKTREIGAALDQIPFALANSLTSAAFKTRQHLIAETWPNSVEVRNKRFLSAALRVEKATKADISAAIVDTLNRAALKKHAEGGVKTGRGQLAIPTKRVIRTGSGVRASQKPRALKRAVRKGNLIFQAEGKGTASRLRLMYRLKPAARIKPDVPFYRDFHRVMLAEVRRAFPVEMAKAMRTRR
jgi:hypothetical protein